MLRVNRLPLPSDVQEVLLRWQTAVSEGNTVSWELFTKKEPETKATLLIILQGMFYNKCAYCETPDASCIEHHWPKTPHPKLNNNRGTPAQMFLWDNLLLSCETCNGFKCKGSHMKWDGDNPRLLNPVKDDPLCYFRINMEDASALQRGRIEPKTALSDLQQKRAEYTIHRLKLNERLGLRNGRSHIIRDFVDWLKMLVLHGANYPLNKGTLRERFLDMLQATRPHLSPIRQLLYEQPEIKQALFDAIPEVAEIIQVWSLPVEGCE